MGGHWTDLTEYYEQEARLRLRRSLRDRRVELRQAYVEVLRRERRASVADFGAGPGRDGEGFQAAGHHVVGFDLARGNARLAAEVGVAVVPASITSLPARTAAFDAGWCLSTLMHLDQSDATAAVIEMRRVLRAGSPLLVGLWGRETEETVLETDGVPGRRRPFHLRSFEHNRLLVAAAGDVERTERWERASTNWDYHVFQVRSLKPTA